MICSASSQSGDGGEGGGRGVTGEMGSCGKFPAAGRNGKGMGQTYVVVFWQNGHNLFYAFFCSQI